MRRYASAASYFSVRRFAIAYALHSGQLTELSAKPSSRHRLVVDKESVHVDVSRANWHVSKGPISTDVGERRLASI
jgi:hypothetical protein